MNVRCTYCGFNGEAIAAIAEKVMMGLACYCPRCRRNTPHELVPGTEDPDKTIHDDPMQGVASGVATSLRDIYEELAKEKSLREFYERKLRQYTGYGDAWFEKAEEERAEEAKKRQPFPPVYVVPAELTREQMDELDQEDVALRIEQYEQEADGEDTLRNYADGIAHGMVTCKYPCSIPCTPEHEQAAADYLLKRMEEL